MDTRCGWRERSVRQKKIMSKKPETVFEKPKPLSKHHFNRKKKHLPTLVSFFSHFFGFLDMTKNSVFFIIFYHPKCTVFGSFLPFPLNKLHFILDFCLKHNTYFTFSWVFTPFSLFLWLAALKSRPTDYFKRGGWPHISLKKSSWALF